LTTPQKSDEALAQACQKGERRAQYALYERYADKSMAICSRYAQHQLEAEEMLQTGWIRVFDKIGQYSGGSLEGWIKRVIVTNCINAYQKRKREEEWLTITDDIDTKAADTEATNPFDTVEIDFLNRLIAQLPQGTRMVFNLFAMEGYSHKEIASMLQIEEASSRSQLTRARIKLQEKILAHKTPLQK